MTTTRKAHLTLDLSDVRKAGGVEAAILAWAAEDDSTSSGVIGSSFSTSGPGSGWSRTHGASDFASRAFEGGALHYLDASDGRVKSCSAPVGEIDEDEETGDRTDEDGNTVLRDIGGCDYVDEGDWSEESVVCLECPSIADALEHPEVAAEMAQAVIIAHGPMSNRSEWAKLVRAIKDAAEAFDDVDADDVEGE